MINRLARGPDEFIGRLDGWMSGVSTPLLRSANIGDERISRLMKNARLECPMQNAKCPMLKIVLNLGIEHSEL
jgi:hypothetical protein